MVIVESANSTKQIDTNTSRPISCKRVTMHQGVTKPRQMRDATFSPLVACPFNKNDAIPGPPFAARFETLDVERAVETIASANTDVTPRHARRCKRNKLPEHTRAMMKRRPTCANERDHSVSIIRKKKYDPAALTNTTGTSQFYLRAKQACELFDPQTSSP
jgi:hypothetical protein